MYIEKSKIEVVILDEAIKIMGLNLQNSGLPINFDSLGKMWGRYTDNVKNTTPNRLDREVEYGISLNKVPDYIVGIEVSDNEDQLEGFKSYTIPAGNYVKVVFNGENHSDLVGSKLMAQLNATKKWAKSEKIKLDGTFTVEVYPKETVEMEYPEMYCLFPIELI